MLEVQMRPAQPGELPELLALVTEVCAWLAERGIRQWSWPLSAEVRQLLAREVAAGEVYWAHAGDAEAIGLLRFEWHDADLWPHDPAGGGYVHSLMVRPTNQGRGVGASMLRWAAKHVHARGRRYLRLDCVADNLVLHSYYLRLGFNYRGVATHNGYTGALFELDLDPAQATAAQL